MNAKMSDIDCSKECTREFGRRRRGGGQLDPPSKTSPTHLTRTLFERSARTTHAGTCINAIPTVALQRVVSVTVGARQNILVHVRRRFMENSLQQCNGWNRQSTETRLMYDRLFVALNTKETLSRETSIVVGCVEACGRAGTWWRPSPRPAGCTLLHSCAGARKSVACHAHALPLAQKMLAKKSSHSESRCPIRLRFSRAVALIPMCTPTHAHAAAIMARPHPHPPQQRWPRGVPRGVLASCLLSEQPTRACS